MVPTGEKQFHFVALVKNRVQSTSTTMLPSSQTISRSRERATPTLLSKSSNALVQPMLKPMVLTSKHSTRMVPPASTSPFSTISMLPPSTQLTESSWILSSTSSMSTLRLNSQQLSSVSFSRLSPPPTSQVTSIKASNNSCQETQPRRKAPAR